ncbi:hypothetical protein B1A99_29005 [Cohnella sp. CIP 111063]|uniref:glycoside hydrolase family 3 N-terminal domain-containing protein n=1 Tax=unclassified Cohnella TaxID=2636738 RepID=UPI000B8C5ADE|nr:MULTISPECIES: glycoside hydrolase family 3 N-terminal domain-containing protein [unclassified Cohnella]OXS53692.1 hypothetical protein B1A99_29005 [Cohnella sp. CIP 111063]PRX61978.1 glycosyl hydrolase family 3 [Cohnella sp. SGD-V74]
MYNFEETIKASKPNSVMSAYNRVNGTLASENDGLLTKVLRVKWGFDGVVITDWGAIGDRVKGDRSALVSLDSFRPYFHLLSLAQNGSALRIRPGATP